MLDRRSVTAPDAPNPAGPYSHAVVAGDFVYTAGFGPQDPETGQIPDGVHAQTVQVLRNVEAALIAAGSGLDRLVKTTVHLATLSDFAEFNDAYREMVPQPYPVRTTVGSELGGILVEIDAVALVR